jgi:hypothetical protein
VNNSSSAGAAWVVSAIIMFASSAGAGSVLPKAKAGSMECPRAARPNGAIFATWKCEERSIRGEPFDIVDSKDSRGPGLIDRVLSALTVYREEVEEGSARVEALSRDSNSKSLSIPLLGLSTRQSVVAGTREFHIAWVGGKPPFAAELVGPSGVVVASWPRTGEHSVAATANLGEGPYEFHITDASGQSVFGAFEATPQPPIVDRSGVDQLPPDLGAALMAARLGDIDDGAWQLEAYERLTAEPSSDATRIVANRLAQVSRFPNCANKAPSSADPPLRHVSRGV